MIGADFRAALVALPPEDLTAVQISSVATLQGAMLAFARSEMDERSFIVIALEVNAVLAEIADDANGVSAMTSAYAPFAIQADAALNARLVELDA
jgi:hypothetical protein